jgi:hypothetical protein
MDVWIRPSLGIFLGLFSSRDKKKGGIILGDWALGLGGLLGLTLGFGRKWGLFTGLLGAVAVIPLLGFGFVGLPIGFHWKKKWGIGLIIPLFWPAWWASLALGLLLFLVGIVAWSSTQY